VATTEPPPLRSLLHQVRNGVRVIEDRSRCQLALTLADGPHLRVETILRLLEALLAQGLDLARKVRAPFR